MPHTSDSSAYPVTVEVASSDHLGFQFDNISYRTDEGKVLIHNISATVGKGEMLAVMVGPSSFAANLFNTHILSRALREPGRPPSYLVSRGPAKV